MLLTTFLHAYHPQVNLYTFHNYTYYNYAFYFLHANIYTPNIFTASSVIPYNTQQYNFHKYNFPQLYIPQYCCITFHKDSQYSQWFLNPSTFPVVEPYSSGPGNGRGAHGQAGAAESRPGIRGRAAPSKGIREIARGNLNLTQISPRPRQHTESRLRKKQA